jgi:hypothetical protein
MCAFDLRKWGRGAGNRLLAPTSLGEYLLDIREIPEELLFLSAKYPGINIAFRDYVEGRLSVDEVLRSVMETLSDQDDKLNKKVANLLAPRARHANEPYT